VSGTGFSTLVVTVSPTVDRRWIRRVTAQLRDVPGVEAVEVGSEALTVSGRMDPEDVRAVVVRAGHEGRRDG
jgi:hypothetical protein